MNSFNKSQMYLNNTSQLASKKFKNSFDIEKLGI